MINRLILAGVMAAVWAGTALAADPVWVGSFFVTAVSNAQCEAKLHDLLTAVFHPKLPGDTSVNRDVLQTFDSQKGYRFSPKTVRFQGNGSYSAESWTGRAVIKDFDGDYSNFEITPETITPTTPFVNITGKLLRYGGLRTCQVTFSAALSLKK